jgi:hypothetical protein
VFTTVLSSSVKLTFGCEETAGVEEREGAGEGDFRMGNFGEGNRSELSRKRTEKSFSDGWCPFRCSTPASLFVDVHM